MNSQVLRQCLTLHEVLRSEMEPTAWQLPTADDCLRYVAQEAAEVCDAEMRLKRNHARNNERDGNKDAIARECADVIIMAHSALMKMGWTPDSTLEFNSYVEQCFAYARRNLTRGGMVLWSDELISGAGTALDAYVLSQDPDEFIEPVEQYVPSVLIAEIVHAMAIMEKTGHNPLTKVYEKSVDFAMKHGERHKDGYGAHVVDKLTEYYDGYMEIQTEWGKENG